MATVSTVFTGVRRAAAARGRRRPAAWPAIPAAAVLALTASAPGLAQNGQQAPEPAAAVEMTDLLTFTPETVTVTVGDTVEWRNVSNIRHTATADPAEAAYRDSVHLPDGAEPFDSGFVEPGESWRYTFEVPGTYDYFCIPHEATGMLGTVVVEAAQ